MSFEDIRRAAKALREASAIVITAGAGMGVDSGLPDFRGSKGFWKAYPPYKRLNMSFESLASPKLFLTDPELAWGFYGHRLDLYKKTKPHEGYSFISRLDQEKNLFVFTTNVDGAFQKVGILDNICEAHGSIHYLQYMRPYFDHSELIDSSSFNVVVDKLTLKAHYDSIPKINGYLLRPNILMFGDPYWNHLRTNEQYKKLYKWLKKTDLSRIVVIEVGTGIVIPTARSMGERLSEENNGILIRINTNKDEAYTMRERDVSIVMRAKKALQEIENEI